MKELFRQVTEASVKLDTVLKLANIEVANRLATDSSGQEWKVSHITVSGDDIFVHGAKRLRNGRFSTDRKFSYIGILGFEVTVSKEYA